MMSERNRMEELREKLDLPAQQSFKSPEERKRIREKIFLERKAVFDALAQY